MKIPTSTRQNTYAKIIPLPTVPAFRKLLLMRENFLYIETGRRVKKMGSTRLASEQDRQPECYPPSFLFNEKITGLLEDDNTISEEYARVYSKRLLSPEEELMAAVLDEAIADYQRYLVAGKKSSMKRFAEVERWVLEDDCEWIFSFVNCCEVLGIRPGYIRQGLLRWKEEKLPRITFPQVKNNHKKPAKKLLRNAA
jgi:hypothetical protein